MKKTILETYWEMDMNTNISMSMNMKMNMSTYSEYIWSRYLYVPYFFGNIRTSKERKNIKFKNYSKTKLCGLAYMGVCMFHQFCPNKLWKFTKKQFLVGMFSFYLQMASLKLIKLWKICELTNNFSNVPR